MKFLAIVVMLAVYVSRDAVASPQPGFTESSRTGLETARRLFRAGMENLNHGGCNGMQLRLASRRVYLQVLQMKDSLGDSEWRLHHAALTHEYRSALFGIVASSMNEADKEKTRNLIYRHFQGMGMVLPAGELSLVAISAPH
jgi:hypothetical protein